MSNFNLVINDGNKNNNNEEIEHVDEQGDNAKQRRKNGDFWTTVLPEEGHEENDKRGEILEETIKRSSIVCIILLFLLATILISIFVPGALAKSDGLNISQYDLTNSRMGWIGALSGLTLAVLVLMYTFTKKCLILLYKCCKEIPNIKLVDKTVLQPVHEVEPKQEQDDRIDIS